MTGLQGDEKVSGRCFKKGFLTSFDLTEFLFLVAYWTVSQYTFTFIECIHINEISKHDVITYFYLVRITALSVSAKSRALGNVCRIQFSLCFADIFCLLNDEDCIKVQKDCIQFQMGKS